MMNPHIDSSKLRRFRIWYWYNRAISFLLALSMLYSLGGMVIVWIFPLALGGAPMLTFVPVFIIGMVLLFLMTGDVWCPVCERRFYGNQSEDDPIGWNQFATKCKHCTYQPPPLFHRKSE
jgi:hypothetical protein